MITCQDARHLFSRYLDGDLPSSLKTELHAHQLNCPSCRDELAMLETCGAVIALDICEPKLSELFTDRVLAARREQLAQIKPRRKTRMVMYAGSSLAAAAGIALVFFMFAPWANQDRKTAISGKKESVPVVAQRALIELGGGDKVITPQAQADLEATEEMSLPKFSEALAKFLQKTQNTVENTRQGFKDLELLLYLAIPDTAANEKIIEQYRLNQGEVSGENPVNQGNTDSDPGDPSSPNLEPSAQPDTDNVLDAL